MPTPLRAIRVPGEIWDLVKARAATEGTTNTAVVLAALTAYLAGRAPEQTQRRAPPAVFTEPEESRPGPGDYTVEEHEDDPSL